MKELDGQCLIAFEKWLDKTCEYTYNIVYNKTAELIDLDDVFNELPYSCKFGVYQDFFDSVGVYIDTNWNQYTREFEFWHDDEQSDDYKTHQEARTAAISKANSLFNHNYSKGI